ncbi:MAG: TonB-dependent receptor [Alphaproteobacteria bacterium]|nr:TonB-dependent receptor [Alphaproteobacteria bacterium]MBU1516321.1 TonB-dependent receptor [Alphaproteobacteria bacterium]MBU2093161.1 TonB-dependent receptor [Alphaproteobacteria bacterium]MBU2150421.1 TonB-dependent receptor [Alphaproteobacteria bacterium]MBU2308797.1 TonB-dependent receptor [Alphaproteobacteria bacterium]
MHHRLIWLAAVAMVPAQAMAQVPAPQKPEAKPPAGTVGEIVVTGQAPAVQTSIDRRSYSVASDLQAQSGSIGDALRNVPSVEVDVNGNVALRGDPNVTILIDGKPSGQFRGEGKGQALQALPAERIDRVEVITNPSAEFSADGTAGVINLITKKAKGVGQTASARLTVGTSERVFANASTGYNGEKLSITADAFLRHDPQKQPSHDVRTQFDPSTGALSGSRIDGVNHAVLDLVGGRVSADYDLDADTRLNAELRVQRLRFDIDILNQTRREDASGALVQVYDRSVSADQRRFNRELTAGLRRKLDGEGHEVSVSLSYEATDFDRRRTGATVGRLPVLPGAFDDQLTYNDYQQVQLKGDYVRPFADGSKLKLGFDLQRDDNSQNNRGFRGPSAPASIPDPALSSEFKFEQLLSQAYVTYERPIGEVTVLAGLRLEDARIDLTQVTLGRGDDNNDLRAYPSLHMSWKASDAQTFTASYSQRVQRPDPDFYNPFPFLIDPVTYRTGNPDLKPQQTRSYELGWQYRKSPANYLATLYYRENDKVLSDVTRDIGGGVFEITRENVAQTRAGGLELVANGRLSAKLTYNVSGNLYWNELDGSAQGLAHKRSTVTVAGRASLSWQVTPDDLIQVNGFANARRLTAQGYIKPAGMLNIGYRHKFNDRISGLVTFQDVLDTFTLEEVVYTPILQRRIRQTIDTRGVQIGIVWTLGGGKPRDQGFDFGGGASGPTP